MARLVDVDKNTVRRDLALAGAHAETLHDEAVYGGEHPPTVASGAGPSAQARDVTVVPARLGDATVRKRREQEHDLEVIVSRR